MITEICITYYLKFHTLCRPKAYRKTVPHVIHPFILSLALSQKIFRRLTKGNKQGKETENY